MAGDAISCSFDLFIEISIMIHESSLMVGSKMPEAVLDGFPTSCLLENLANLT